MITAGFNPQDLEQDWTAALKKLAEDRVVHKLWDGDHTAIQTDPTEVANRLGWLHVIEDSLRQWPRWVLSADEIAEGASHKDLGEFDHVLILGMGGSSLFPEVLARTFAPGEGFPELIVLDSTDPAAILRTAALCDPERTIVVAASKSGSTIETRSHLAYFWNRQSIGKNFVAITDPGSDLEALAASRNFRFIAHGVPEIGGRFSALSAFGMVPGALMGLDADDLLCTAEEAADMLGRDVAVEDHLGCQLGALMAVAAQHGRDKLTFLIEEPLAAFGGWVEQLIAESTGKHGVGVLPVVGEPADSPDAEHRLYVVIGDVDLSSFGEEGLPGPSVHLGVEEPQDMGAQVFLWEFATTIAGVVLGINPFDQPDVESAKLAARGILTNRSEAPEETGLQKALEQLRPGDALVIGAFVDPVLEPELQASRLALGRSCGVATTLGIGPRFLHSTGQLHKGGPDRMVFVQVVSDDEADVAIPGETFSFGELKHAQADGDLAALQASGKRAFRVSLEELLQAGQ
ncbi:glucose-6-phosphate isomerase [Actinobacteria bacterium IMCC26207]|nr:glucose-6-phosphate isomerase [Actinobacteria bacterium IMCC26207]